MCGYVGAFLWDKQVDDFALKDGLKVLSHRGPDGEGIWVSDCKNIGFGHCRLRIIDLETGAQPLLSEDGTVVAVVNGEFYGFEEIREDLVRKGHKFQTLSDSEILIHLYEEYSVDCLKYLRGEFSFLLWDQGKQRLFAARDRFGVKPLCYTVTDNGIYFASEAKALFKMGALSAAWDEEAFYHAMSLQYTPPDKTLFKNIFQLQPGYMLLAEKRNVRVRKYWDMDYPKVSDLPVKIDEKPFIIECRDRLRATIKDRLRADVPVCFHLSGGIDSSAVLGLSADMMDTTPEAFTVSFSHEDYDELALAQNMADRVGANLHVVNVSQDDLVHVLPKAVYYGEGLAINGHFGAKYLLNDAIHKAGFKVALTGEGADEVFAGYPHLRQDMFALDGQTEKIKSLLDSNTASAGVMMALGEELPLTAVQKKLGYVPAFLRAKASLGYRLHSVLSEDYLQRFVKTDCYGSLMAKMPVKEQLADRHVVHQSLYLWTKLALANYILRTLGDGMEMSHSVEGRLPFLDHRLFNFLKNIPMSLKIKDGVEKYILREAVKPYVTPEIYRRQKHPFMAPPIAVYSNDILNHFIQDNLRSAVFKNIPFFDHRKLTGLLDRIEQMNDRERSAMEPVLMTVLTAGLLQKQFGL